MDYRSLRKEIVGRLKGAAANSPAPKIARALIGKKKVSAVFYHKPAPDLFERHLAFYRKNFNPISMQTLREAIENGDERGLPDRPLLITIDDGYRENEALLPAIQNYKAPVIIYLVAGAFATKRKFWYEAVWQAGGNPEDYKRLPDARRLELLKARYDFENEREYKTATALSLATARKMMKTGLVSFGAHTVNHPVLTMCDDDRCESEISLSRVILEEKLQTPILDFSYPNGDYGPREKRACDKGGFKSARGLVHAWLDVAKCDRFDLPVIGCPESSGDAALELLSVGYVLLREKFGKIE